MTSRAATAVPPPVPVTATDPAARAPLRGGRRVWIVMAAAVALLAVAVVLSLAVGARVIAPADVWAALVSGGSGDDGVVVRDLRVPRTLVGLVVGAALGVAGVLIQGHTRNPIADPGLLGVSAGAGFAVAAGIALTDVREPLGYVWFSFPGAFIAGTVVFVLGSTGRGAATPVTLALAGAGVAALLAGLTTALVLLDPDSLQGQRFWAVGSVAGRGMEVLLPLLPFFALGFALAVANTRALNSLVLGEDTARALGLRVPLARAVGIAAVTLLTGAAVAAAGPIGFLGLVVPHTARALVGTDHRLLVPLAALLGGGLLLACDVLGRLAAQPGELRVGVVLAGVGAPFFIALVRSRKPVAL